MKTLKEYITKHQISEKLTITKDSEITSKDWSIEDAEDGDIIISRYNQFIYKGLNKDKKYCPEPTAIIYYACYNLSLFHNLEPLHIGPDIGVGSLKDKNYQEYKLSSKEECKELFDALKKKGYEWDEKNLKLIKL